MVRTSETFDRYNEERIEQLFGRIAELAHQPRGDTVAPQPALDEPKPQAQTPASE